MIRRILFLAFFIALATAAGALTPEEKRTKLATTPISVYPNFDVQGTSFVATFNGLARTGDALVVSYVDAFKPSFRAGAVGVSPGAVWIYTNHSASLTQTFRKNVADAGGIIYIPDSFDDVRTPRAARELHEDAAAFHLPLVVGLAHRDTYVLVNIGEIARHGDYLAIYAVQVLREGATAYRNYVQRVVAAARAANPAIKIELDVAVARDPKSTAAVVDVISRNIDLADRIGVYCDDSVAAAESLKTIVGGLRGGQAQVAVNSR